MRIDHGRAYSLIASFKDERKVPDLQEQCAEQIELIPRYRSRLDGGIKACPPKHAGSWLGCSGSYCTKRILWIARASVSLVRGSTSRQKVLSQCATSRVSHSFLSMTHVGCNRLPECAVGRRFHSAAPRRSG